MAYRASLSFYFSFVFENLLAKGFWPLLVFFEIDADLLYLCRLFRG
jgi:hypothetical protein